jgi:hypothetical protein
MAAAVPTSPPSCLVGRSERLRLPRCLTWPLLRCLVGGRSSVGLPALWQWPQLEALWALIPWPLAVLAMALAAGPALFQLPWPPLPCQTRRGRCRHPALHHRSLPSAIVPSLWQGFGVCCPQVRQGPPYGRAVVLETCVGLLCGRHARTGAATIAMQLTKDSDNIWRPPPKVEHVFPPSTRIFSATDYQHLNRSAGSSKNALTLLLHQVWLVVPFGLAQHRPASALKAHGSRRQVARQSYSDQALPRHSRKLASHR